jgi:hypothetical protein
MSFTHTPDSAIRRLHHGLPDRQLLGREVARVRPREVVERFVRGEVTDREDVHARRVPA